MNIKYIKSIKRDCGYATLVSVLVAGSIGISISISLILLGVGISRTSLVLEQSNEAKAITNACAEEALQQIRSSVTFSGSGNLNIGNGSCSYTVTNIGGQNREIESTGTVDEVVRKLEISIDSINPEINIVLWQEVPDF